MKFLFIYFERKLIVNTGSKTIKFHDMLRPGVFPKGILYTPYTRKIFLQNYGYTTILKSYTKGKALVTQKMPRKFIYF